VPTKTPAPKAPTTTDLSSFEMKFGRVTFHLLGSTPLIYHSMAQKAWRELLKPKGRMTQADKANNLKHDPLKEFRDSVYQLPGDGPTRLVFPSTNFKQAIADVALRVPGVKKTEIQQLVTVESDPSLLRKGYVPIYGIPDLRMDIVRMADMNHTPDVRTRACLPHWATSITVRYAQPNLSGDAVAKLVQAAGMVMGLGDFRIGKGAGDHGQWEIVADDDPRFLAIKQAGGRAVQDAALDSPGFYDETAADLYTWFVSEMDKRDENTRPASLRAVA
jgi:hypothetical protein